MTGRNGVDGRTPHIAVVRNAGMVLGVALGLSACTGSDVEEDYLARVTVAGSDAAVVVHDEAVTGVFLVPPDTDAGTAVTGPELVMRPATDRAADPFRELAATGSGQTADGTRCDVRVYRTAPSRVLAEAWELSAEDTAAWETGRLTVVRLAVGCPFAT